MAYRPQSGAALILQLTLRPVLAWSFSVVLCLAALLARVCLGDAVFWALAGAKQVMTENKITKLGNAESLNIEVPPQFNAMGER
jgi:hypothetical protein